jgi:N-acetylneuraminate synthase
MPDAVFIVAEAGVNHNGSLDLAKKLVDIAADAGADAVKFQTFKANQLVTRTATKAEYQLANSGDSESHHEMIKRLELNDAAHYALIQHCEAQKIEFLSTPFDIDSLEFLATRCNLSRLKFSSGDITNAPLLLEAARIGKPVILSTGMSNLGEIETALGILAFGYCGSDEQPSAAAFERAYGCAKGRRVLQERVTLLHCTTEYPAPFADINLHAMVTMGRAFGLPVGYSDHTTGIAVPLAAVALGATLIEKHFTTDRRLPGPDHQASLEPQELKEMVRSIRDVEAALGSPVKMPVASELKNRLIARKSLVAARDIQKGERFTHENLAIKRPAGGVNPTLYWEMLGKMADRDYRQDEMVDP